MKEEDITTNTGTGERKSLPTPKKIKIPGFLAAHVRNYPGETEFHITSDGMVFLSREEDLAQAHQRTLKKGKLQTIKVK